MTRQGVESGQRGRTPERSKNEEKHTTDPQSTHSAWTDVPTSLTRQNKVHTQDADYVVTKMLPKKSNKNKNPKTKQLIIF